METTDRPSPAEPPRPAADDHGEFLRLAVGIWRRKSLIIAVTILWAVLFFLLTSLKPSQYTSSATLLLDPRQQQLASSSDQVVADLDITDPVMANEIAVLRSSTLLTRVVQRIGIDRFNDIDPGLAQQSLTMQMAGHVRQLFGVTSHDMQDYDLIPLEERRMNRIVRTLRSGLRIRRIEDSFVIEISVTTGLAELSANVANTLSQIYVESQLRERQKVIEIATNWLAEQVELREADLNDAEQRVETAKKENLNFAGASQEVLEQQAMALNQSLSTVRADRTQLIEELAILDSISPENPFLANLGSGSYPTISALQSTRHELTQEQARLAILFGPNHQKRRLIEAEIERVKTAFSDEITKQKRTLNDEIGALGAREKSLTSDILKIEQSMADISERSLTLRQLETEADAIRDGYETALLRLADTRAQLQIQRSEAKIMNTAAIPAGPSAPRIKLMTGFGASLGLSLGLIFALLLEVLEKGFRRNTDIERTTGLTVMARLPIQRSAASVGLYFERIRQLWTIVAKRTSDGPMSIMLTSAMPSEGKTTTAYGLAEVAASAGHSVILLDLDTRQKSLSRQIGLMSGPDLYAHLTEGVELTRVIHPVEDSGFDFAGVGGETVGAPNYSARALFEMITVLKDRYDIVIIDTPPLLPVSDSLSIAPFVDEVLYLVQYDVTSRGSVTEGLAALRNVNVVPTGVVMSRTDPRAEPRGYPQNSNFAPQRTAIL